MAHFLVTSGHGPAWDDSKTRRTQPGFDEHAEYMDGLVDRGFVLLGGPVGDDLDAGDALLLVTATDEAEVRSILATDPWFETVLTLSSVQRWTLWLKALEL